MDCFDTKRENRELTRNVFTESRALQRQKETYLNTAACCCLLSSAKKRERKEKPPSLSLSLLPPSSPPVEKQVTGSIKSKAQILSTFSAAAGDFCIWLSIILDTNNRLPNSHRSWFSILNIMFKAPDHQVAGHQARNGMLGPLIDDSGRFYKPLQGDERGSREVAFYTSFFSNARIPNHIRRFFPMFHGTQLLQASDESGLHPHLVLQDFVSNRLNPSVMDIKIGSRTWYPKASEDYIQKCLKKDRESTSLPLGFRISGLRTYESEKSGFWVADKKYVKGFTLEDVKTVLRKFVSSNPSSHTEPDCSMASIVYGGSDGILAQLLELKAWFEDQTIFHFSSCSVLMVYEKRAVEAAKVSGPEVKLVDFAHVVDGEGVMDHNFLGGLCSLIKIVSEILTRHIECSAKSGMHESQKT